MLNRYIIERKVPGVGESSKQDFIEMAGKSNQVLQSLGPKIQWVQSFVTNDKIYCEYLAEDENTIKEHAKMAGFPADNITKVTKVLDPTTANTDFDMFQTSKKSEQKPALHS